MKKINVFWGSDNKFDDKLKKVNNKSNISEILNHINRTKIEVSGCTSDNGNKLIVENLIIHTDDYGCIKEWALMGFYTNILQNDKLEIYNLWLNNPPTQVYSDIIRFSGEIVLEEQFKINNINLQDIKKIVDEYKYNVIGQDNIIKKIASTLYLLTNEKRKNPVSILFLGDSGIGKTETAKYIGNCLGQNILRIQFSMQQTFDAHKFIFGAEHGENSLARELIRRESNIVLLDEFDKVHSSLYNAFYQMFDEGVFVDSNYSVNMEKCLIICTSNYKDEAEAEEHLGTPIYSRFSKVIRFQDITIENREKIAINIFNKLIEERNIEEQGILNEFSILNDFIKAISKGSYKNIRMLKNDMDDAMNYCILKKLEIID